MKIRPYSQNKLFLFPPRLQDFVPLNHESYIIDDVFERLELESFYSRVPEVGNPSYHHRLMMKKVTRK